MVPGRSHLPQLEKEVDLLRDVDLDQGHRPEDQQVLQSVHLASPQLAARDPLEDQRNNKMKKTLHQPLSDEVDRERRRKLQLKKHQLNNMWFCRQVLHTLLAP